MSVPRVLLLISWSPSSKHGGEVLLRTLLRHYPEKRLCCFALLPNCDGLNPMDLEGFPISCAPSPREGSIRRFGHLVAHLSSLVLHQYIRRIRLKSLIEQAVRIGRENKIEMVWAVLNRPTIIYMAESVASALGARLVTTVMDPPERLAVALGLDGLSRRYMLRAFAKVLHSSARCGVASETMKEEYRELHGVDPVVLIHGVHPDLVRPPSTELAGEDTFVIGLAGSIYAVREWESLLSALSSVNWCIGRREVIVRVLGSSMHLRTQGKMHVEYLGWRSVEETLDIVSRCDIAYVPYWFDESYSLAVRLSFPNKLATYLAAGRPVFYHGPEESSPARFFQRFPVGLCCHSLKEDDIIKTLSRFVADRDLYANAALQTQAAVGQELNLRVLLRRFAELIGISEADLLPLRRQDRSSLGRSPTWRSDRFE